LLQKTPAKKATPKAKTTAVQPPTAAVHLDLSLQKVFSKIDVDSSGKVSHPELLREIQEAVPGSDVTETEVLELIRDYDKVR